MKNILVILLVVALGLVSCNREKKGPGGLLYTIHHTEGKQKIKEGDIVKMEFVEKNDKDSVSYSTYDLDQPQVFPVGKKVYAGDMNDVLTLFGEGDSVTFKLNLDTMYFYQKQPKPIKYKNDKYMTFTVKFVKVFPRNAKESDSLFRKRAATYFEVDYKNYLERLKKSEANKISSYIADNKLNVKTTATGLSYIITKQGDNERPNIGDTILVNYTGIFAKKNADGTYKLFDTSIEKKAREANKLQLGRPYGPTKMIYGKSSPGLNESLSLIGKGGKITSIIPSKIAYGEKGMPQGGIGPYSPLVFDLEVVDFIKQKAQ